MRGKSLTINEKKSEKNGKMSDDNKRMEKNKSGGDIESSRTYGRRRQWHLTPVLLTGKSMDGVGWWAAVPGVAKSRTRLSDFNFTFTFMHRRRKWQPTPVFLPGES